MIQLLMIREFFRRVDKRILGIAIILIAGSVFFIYQSFFLSFSFLGAEPTSAVTSPTATSLFGYHTKEVNKYRHYVPLTVEFTDPNGNITNVLAYYSTIEGSIGTEFVNRDFDIGSNIFGYFFTKAIRISEDKPDPLPDYTVLYVETQTTVRDGSTYGNQIEVLFRLSYNIQLTEDEKTNLEELEITPISIISHYPPSGLGAVSWELFMIIPIVLTVLAYKRREKHELR